MDFSSICYFFLRSHILNDRICGREIPCVMTSLCLNHGQKKESMNARLRKKNVKNNNEKCWGKNNQPNKQQQVDL